MARKKTQVIREIFGAFKPSLVIETGTFLANTTRFFAELLAEVNPAGKVTTVELNDLFHNVSVGKLSKYDNVECVHASSNAFFGSAKLDRRARTVFYLDAHWNDYLPLRDELKEIVSFRESIVIIDDFKVETDVSGFGYDDYGNVIGRLDLDHISDLLDEFRIFFPTYSAEEDGGNRRGVVFLSKGDAAFQVLKNCSGLSEFTQGAT